MSLTSAAPTNAVDPLIQRATGAYYTPGDAAAWMARWLIDNGVRTILEPSSGDGSFIAAITALAKAEGIHTVVHAVEIDAAALDDLDLGPDVRTINSDVHLVEPFPVDAVIGNPPFVRFRHLESDEAREAARRAGSVAMGGVHIDAAGSIWMTVVLHAVSFLRPGGRAAFVLPADALYVNYARPFWRFMAGRFGELRVVRCRERIFPDILQDVVVLLADRSGSSTAAVQAELYATRLELTASHGGQRVAVRVADVLSSKKPFGKALLGEPFQAALHQFEQRTIRADAYVKFNIGYVDANKRFFHPGQAVRDAFELPERSLLPAAEGGRSMAGAGVATSSLSPSSIQRLWLPDPNELSDGERAYIRHGEAAGVHLGYKTSRRTPWYRVPDVRVPDLLMTVFGELPKLMLNDRGLVGSNSLMLGFWRATVDVQSFLLAWYSSPTRLGIELAVHALGGGVLVVVPREADAVRMPSLPTQPAPQHLLDELDAALRAKDLLAAYRVGDAYLVQSGWKWHELDQAREMADLLLAWRVDR